MSLGYPDVASKNGRMDSAPPVLVKVLMPRFSIDTQAQLGDVTSLGMPLAFRGAADFTGIHVPTGVADRLFISAVIHQANINVDRRGRRPPPQPPS